MRQSTAYEPRFHDLRLTRVYLKVALSPGSVVELPSATAAPLAELPLAVTLGQFISRGERMVFIVQKATELGVARIVPVLSQRSVVRLDQPQAASKAAHWRSIAVNACEQCGRNRLPTIDAPRQLIRYLGDS